MSFPGTDKGQDEMMKTQTVETVILPGTKHYTKTNREEGLEWRLNGPKLNEIFEHTEKKKKKCNENHISTGS